MDSLYILIPVGVILIGIAVAIFVWAVNNHQFDDLDSEAQRLLFNRDDIDPETPPPADAAPERTGRSVTGAARPESGAPDR